VGELLEPDLEMNQAFRTVVDGNVIGGVHVQVHVDVKVKVKAQIAIRLSTCRRCF